MSGFGGFGGFGQNNNNQQQPQQQPSTGFGGFGANNTSTSTGFGAANNTGFGSNNNAGGGLFGAGNTTTTTGFGSTGGAFGSPASTGAFGANKPSGFGTPASTGGGLFGSNTATAGGFGGFGSTPAAATTGFGASNSTGERLFGGTKSPFGAQAATTGGFGSPANTGFGGAPTTGAFGSPASTALGGNLGECQGTGSVPFQPFTEKEPNSASNQQNAFQSICFQQPYQKFSPEELRLADYNQGRRHGNGTNQATGAFGTTNFGATGGGFGSTNNTTAGGFGSNAGTTGGLFGGGTTGGFGTSQPSTGFGSTPAATTGGLFGAAKPATGGLFGAPAASQPTGGAFGNTATNTSGGFGQTGSTGFGAANTGGGLFGSNTAAAKPAFSFGNNTNTPAAAGTGFGATTTPAANTGFGGGGGGLFGNTNAQQTNTTGGFGQPAANTGNAFGGFGHTNTQNQPAGTGGLFGNNNQQKPAGGLFGSTPAATGTSGLFGNSQPATNSTPFGASNNNNNNNTGGLFGAAKPATGGLFGAAPAATTGTTGGLFGGGFGQTQNQPQQQQQQQQQNAGGLFGSLNNNNNQQKPSLFGATNTQQSGGGLFGNSGSQQPSGGLFGAMNNNTQQQQQPQSSMFGNTSLFGGSQQGQQPTSLTASINDSTAFGGSSLFASLATNQVINPGPIATPLSGSVRAKRNAALPMYKLNSASASHFSTPQKRGFGFSYNSYASPGSVSSTTSTPGGLGGSLLGSGNSFGRLSKSMSVSSLRRSFNSEDGILAPGAFTASPNPRNFGSTGGMKKLTISRNLRQDLFSPPSHPQPSLSSNPAGGILKKRVSFGPDTGAVNGSASAVPSPLKQMANGSPSSEDLGLLRPRSNGKENATQPEMEHVPNLNNQLAIVNEEAHDAPARAAESARPISHEDQEPGEYWTSPSQEELSNMNHVQRQKVTNFTVGRYGVGQVRFNVPVDLSKTNVDDLVEKVVVIVTRSVTVYPDPAKKPPMGKGLNVPATITLENSWPRKRDGTTPISNLNDPRCKKHVDRLKKVADTTFVSYDSMNGIWSFSVEHFTTYGYDEDEDEDDMEETNEFGQSTMSIPPDSPTPKSRTPRSIRMDQSFASTSEVTQTESDPDDTFEFRKSKRALPGAFDQQESYGEAMEDEYDDQEEQSFLDERSVGSPSECGVDEPMEEDDVFQDDGSVSIVDQDMAGAYPEADNTAELSEDSQDVEDDIDDLPATPGAVLKARMRALKNLETPSKKFAAGDDWAATLQNTVSPKKQDRALLKRLIDLNGDDIPGDLHPTPTARRVASDGRGFANSIDLMNSLFQTRIPVKMQKVPAKSGGFEWPYSKRSKTGDHDISRMEAKERAFHDSMKPTWGPDGTLVYANPPNPKTFGRSSRRNREKDGLLCIQRGGIVSEHRDVRFAKFSDEASADHLTKHKSRVIVVEVDGVPFAKLPRGFKFGDFVDDRNVHDPAAVHEKLVWQLAGVLFDEIPVPKELKQVANIDERLRKDKLANFWGKLVDDASSKNVALARSNEEKAIAALSGHNISEACDHLINSGDFHLATLVALIGSKDSMRKDMREQLNDWKKSQILSEFSQPVRAIYELLAGNVTVCDGSKGAGALEDRIESFVISKRFGLDWRQAFGLRLWYGTPSQDGIGETIGTFASSLAQKQETAFPHAWYVEQKVPALWKDEDRQSRTDFLWGLLRLYEFEKARPAIELSPENCQLSPLDVRLSWQLCQTLASCGTVPQLRKKPTQAEVDSGDAMTIAFASQLTNEGSWLDAIFVFLHLTKADARKKAVQNHLAHHAGRIGLEDSHSFRELTRTYRIPPPWIWEAKALYMRSVEKDPIGEVECLIKAGSFNEAHRTFAKEVAPQTIIELDYDTLRTLLDGLSDKQDTIREWSLGGEIYQDYLTLLHCEKKGRTVDALVLSRLLSGLPAVVEEARHPGFLETVAIETMSGHVAKAVVNMGKDGEKSNLTKVLRLPLTEDKYLKHTVELSLEYYGAVMANAR